MALFPGLLSSAPVAPSFVPSRLALSSLGLCVALASLGCGSNGATPSAATPSTTKATAKTTPSALTCPALATTASRDLVGLFGVDAALASRIARTVALTAELERSARALDVESREICALVARDLAPASSPPLAADASRHPCELAVERLVAARSALGALSMSISNVSCGIPKNTLARCAGECLTGRTDVVSAVTCSSVESCGLDFSLPDASPACTVQCGARALREVRCNATIDVRSSDPRWTAERIDALRVDLPRLAAFGDSMGPRAVQLGEQVEGLVDGLAATIDELTASKPAGRTPSTELLDRRVVVGAVLAGCVAPALAQTLRASSSLGSSVHGVLRLHGALAAR